MISQTMELKAENPSEQRHLSGTVEYKSLVLQWLSPLLVAIYEQCLTCIKMWLNLNVQYFKWIYGLYTAILFGR